MQNVLTHEMIRSLAPAVLTEECRGSMSSKYSHISTIGVIEEFEEHGFYPVQAKQDKVNSRDPRYVRHAVVLRHESSIGTPSEVGEEVPQILLINSHNGRTKLRLHAGLYRFVCANGLVIGQDKFRAEVVHKGNIIDSVATYVEDYASNLSQIAKTIDIWRGIELTAARADEFAREAAVLRFGSEGAKMFTPNLLLEARREEDENRNLWRVFNRVQENTTKGGLKATSATGRAISTREIVGIGRDLSYNDALWQLAEAFV